MLMQCFGWADNEMAIVRGFQIASSLIRCGFGLGPFQRQRGWHWWVWDRKILVYESISIEFESCVENKGKTGHTIWYAQVMFTSIVFTSYNRCVMLGQYKKQLRNWSDFHNLIQITTKSASTHCSRVTHTSVKCIIGSFDTLILTWHHPLLRMWLFAYLALYQM